MKNNMSKTDKKLVYPFLILLLITVSFCQAQETIYEMNFDDFDSYNEIQDGIYEFPDGWVQYDVDGLNLNEDQLTQYFPEPNVGFSLIESTKLDESDISGGVAIAGSFFETTATPKADDWLCSPGIEIPTSGLVLTWESKSQDAEFKESFEVYITTAGNDEATLTSLTTEDRVKNIINEKEVWTKHSVNLNDYAGETIYIAFHLYSTDKFLLLIDDIQIIDPGNSIDVVLNTQSIDPPVDYGLLLLDQVKPIGPFVAPINNISGQEIESVKFSITIEELTGGIDALLNATTEAELSYEPVWEKSATFAGPYEPFSESFLELNESFLPDHIGVYSIQYKIEQDSDENLENNTSERYLFEITEKRIGRHAFYHTYTEPALLSDFEAFYSTPDDEVNNDVSPTGEYGVVLEFDEFSVLDSVSLLLNAPTGNISVNVYAFNDESGIDAQPIATNTVDVGPSGNTFSYYVFPMLEPVNLTPGKYFISANDPSDGSLTMVFCNYYHADNSSFIRLNDVVSWSELNEVVPVIEAILGELPDPATEIETVTSLNGATFTGTATSNGFVQSYTWDFGNGNTEEGAFVSYTFPTPGTYEVCLTADTGNEILEECTQITIGAATTVDFSSEVSNFTVNFTTSSDGAIASYTWDFGDENTSEDANPVHTYDSEGDYTVCLVATIDETTTLEACNDVEITCDFNGNVVATNTDATATTIGGEGPFSFTWKDADGNEIITTEQGLITGLISNTNYSVEISDVNGCSLELTFTTQNFVMGINDIELVEQLAIYPNPATTFIQLKMELAETSNVSYEIFDLNGKKVGSFDFGSKKQVNESINTSMLQTGLYLLSLDINGKKINKSIVVQN